MPPGALVAVTKREPCEVDLWYWVQVVFQGDGNRNIGV